MRDSVYEVQSPCLAVPCNTDVITLIFNFGFNQFLFEFLLFEIALTSEKIMVASLGGRGILKNQKFIQKSCETAIKCTFEQFISLLSIDDLISEDAHRGYHDVLKSQGSLKNSCI